MKQKDKQSEIEFHKADDWEAGQASPSRAAVPVEQPVELRVDDRHLVTLFCTPGHLEELATGFLLGQGFVSAADDIAAISVDGELKRVDVELRSPLALGNAPARRTVIYSGCGQGPLQVADAAAGPEKPLIGTGGGPVPETAKLPSAAALREALSKTLRRGNVYRATRGVHSAAICSPKGSVMALREDVGRHNALDKALGWAAGRCLDPGRVFVAASGRVSSEAVDKLVRFGIMVMVAKGVPTSLALGKADEMGVTVAGSIGPARLRIYTHSERIAP